MSGVVNPLQVLLEGWNRNNLSRMHLGINVDTLSLLWEKHSSPSFGVWRKCLNLCWLLNGPLRHSRSPNCNVSKSCLACGSAMLFFFLRCRMFWNVQSSGNSIPVESHDSQRGWETNKVVTHRKPRIYDEEGNLVFRLTVFESCPTFQKCSTNSVELQNRLLNVFWHLR